LKIIDFPLMQDLTKGASASPRLRLNHNLHPTPQDPVQRLCNALEPHTYVRPHFHPRDDGWELLALLSGAVAVLTFDGDGRVAERVELSEEGPLGMEIPANTWHTLASLQSGTVVLEVKPGPYVRLTDKDFARWAPEEGDPRAPAFVEWFQRAQVGASPP
jgi:cupin fold WbuC family metalloprotein